MEYVKLTEPGSSHVLTVTAVTVNEEGKWPDYNLSDGATTIVIPKSAADRQLERMKLATAHDLVGATVKVSRSEKPGANGKHFWNLEVVSAREAKPSKRLAPPSAAPSHAPRSGGAHIPDMDDESPYDNPGPLPAWHRNVPPPDDEGPAPEPKPTPREQREQTAGKSDREATYLALWDHVAAHLAATCAQHRIALDASAVQAATATVYIATQR